MIELTPEFLTTIIEVGGSPALIGVILYYMWTHGPKQDLSRMATTISEIRTDLHEHRDAVLAEQAGHRERIQRLEILADIYRHANGDPVLYGPDYVRAADADAQG